MNDASEMQVINGCLTAPVPDILDETVLGRFNRSVLEQVSSRSIRRVLLDVSARHILDSVGFTSLVDCAKTLCLLGAKVVFVGFQPGVVSALVDLDVCLDDITCVGTLEDGYALFSDNEGEEEEADILPDEDDGGINPERGTDEAESL